MRTTVLALSVLVGTGGPARADAIAASATVKITNTHLVATCFDGKPVASTARSWDVVLPVSLTFTMRNEPRPGIENVPPGLAMISFTPESGHKYEVEVQATAIANSQRVWPRGKWAPVIRDRTTDRTVSSEPKWLEAGCQ
jgi:hypothetical protein